MTQPVANAGGAHCALLRHALPPDCCVQWLRVVSRAEPHAPALAHFSEHVGDSIDSLERVFSTTLVATDTPAGHPPAVWVFYPDKEPYVPDGLEVDASGAYALADGYRTWLPDTHDTYRDGAAHRAFMRAVEAHFGSVVCAAACASGAAVQCAKGVIRFLDRGTHLVSCHAHTTHEALVVQLREQEIPLERARTPPIDSDVTLLPTLVRATVMGAAAPSAPLGDALYNALESIRAPAPREYISVRIGLALGELGLDDEIVWPLALCLVEGTREEDAPRCDIDTLSVAELLRRGSTMFDVSSPLPPADTRMPSPDGDDVFGGIADLTADDFLFFGAPMPQLERRSPTPQALLALETPQRSPSMLRSPAEFAPTPWTPADTTVPERRYSSLVPVRYGAVDGPSPDATINGKYDTHGKFFVPAAPERPHRFDPQTPQSVSVVGTVPSSPSSESDDDDEAPRAQRAISLLHLHSSLWDWSASREPPITADLQHQRCALASRFTTCCAASARPLPPPPPLLAQPASAIAIPPPDVLVGCQRAVVEASCAAPAFWTTLGLEPLYGEKNVCANVVISGNVHVETVHEWLDSVAREFARHRLGTHKTGDVFVLHGSSFLRAGIPATLRAVWNTGVVYFVHSEPQGYELLLESRPPSGTIVPLAASDIVPTAVQVPQELAHLAVSVYNAAQCRGAQPAYILSPRNYISCSWLSARTTFTLAWSAQYKDVLHHGRVLHVAYDINGGIVRIVGMDDRVQFRFSRVFRPTGDAIASVWQVIASELHASPAVDWHLVVCRLGPMPVSEARAWADRGGAPNMLRVVIACIERGAMPLSICVDTSSKLVHNTERNIAAVFPGDALLVGNSEALLARKSALMVRIADELCDAYSLHLVGVQSLSNVGEDEAVACLDDVVRHYAALTAFSALHDTNGESPFLPWHVALLYD